jgi:hypothetical protein
MLCNEIYNHWNLWAIPFTYVGSHCPGGGYIYIQFYKLIAFFPVIFGRHLKY